ncbi:MAG: DUF4251 domain-containing protein [Massilibacteroides sp.]|nr:DUF4251 domain-containing protein [Massilibacteroides sp.]MDD3064160.1 DUF4251 domain-containing protein [Massilibacteroides sp.]MDD4114584.1 DUF4251 domain-containing protein [Massilibacteroides sp.]MDD4660782.1 DUF4251 domain-containing protein [Massilibacteroides sp.]
MCRFLILLGIVSLLGGQSLLAQEGKDEKEQQIKTLIDSGIYRLEVDRALPMGGRSVNLTSSYGFEIKGDSIYSHLPYYGRAYSVPYGGGNGLSFDKPIENYDVTYDEKNKATITFSTRSDDDRHEFRVQIYSNGTASVFIQPVNRQSITFQGNIVLPEK